MMDSRRRPGQMVKFVFCMEILCTYGIPNIMEEAFMDLETNRYEGWTIKWILIGKLQPELWPIAPCPGGGQ